MHFHVGAYGMSPCGTQWDPSLEAAFIEGLRTLPFLAGLEIPYFQGGFHRWDEAFFCRHADPSWTYVATGLPSLMPAVKQDPRFGLSSNNEAARRAAVESIAALRTSLHRLHDRLGRPAVRFVEIHSGTAGSHLAGAASVTAFAQSLSEIGAWDWGGAALVVEHCDAAIPGQAYEKGFLGIEQEIAAIRIANSRLPTPIGGAVNWGRSAIEGRGTAAPVQHAALLAEAGLMRGLIFSGCSGQDGPFGPWHDTHMPQAPEPYAPSGATGSLLTGAEMRATLAAAGTLGFAGLKTAIRPADAPVPDRIALLRDGLTVLAAAVLAEAPHAA